MVTSGMSLMLMPVLNASRRESSPAATQVVSLRVPKEGTPWRSASSRVRHTWSRGYAAKDRCYGACLAGCASVSDGDPDGDRRHGGCLCGYRCCRVLECGVLGGCHLRRVHPVFERGSLGTLTDVPGVDAQQPVADVVAWAEPVGLPPLWR